MSSPADTLIAGSQHWRALLTGQPRVGTCYRCAQQSVALKECCGSWGLIEWLCEACAPATIKPTEREGA